MFSQHFSPFSLLTFFITSHLWCSSLMLLFIFLLSFYCWTILQVCLATKPFPNLLPTVPVKQAQSRAALYRWCVELPKFIACLRTIRVALKRIVRKVDGVRKICQAWAFFALPWGKRVNVNLKYQQLNLWSTFRVMFIQSLPSFTFHNIYFILFS